MVELNRTLGFKKAELTVITATNATKTDAIIK